MLLRKGKHSGLHIESIDVEITYPLSSKLTDDINDYDEFLSHTDSPNMIIVNRSLGLIYQEENIVVQYTRVGRVVIACGNEKDAETIIERLSKENI